MYAIVNYKGRQYKVSEGSELLLDKVGPRDKELELADVVLVNQDGKIKVGNPFVKGAKVICEILGEEKGKKVRVLKYKAKSRYRKLRGFRPQYTRVRVQKIQTS